jgi:hypothetical protein
VVEESDLHLYFGDSQSLGTGYFYFYMAEDFDWHPILKSMLPENWTPPTPEPLASQASGNVAGTPVAANGADTSGPLIIKGEQDGMPVGEQEDEMDTLPDVPMHFNANTTAQSATTSSHIFKGKSQRPSLPTLQTSQGLPASASKQPLKSAGTDGPSHSSSWGGWLTGSNRKAKDKS